MHTHTYIYMYIYLVLQDGDTIYTAHKHPSLTPFSTNNFISILYFNAYFKPYFYNLTFYIGKLVLMLFVIHPSKNTSLKMATIGGRNILEAYDVYDVTNLHIFIGTCWFILKIAKNMFTAIL